jgi:membrane protease YdiL (CAAX protease family)
MTAPSSSSPWGIWATAGFSLIVVAAFLLVQLLASAMLVAIELRKNPVLDAEAYSQSLAGNGLLLALATVGGMLTTVTLVGVFVRLRKTVSVSQYLHLYPVQPTILIRWLGLMLALALLWDAATYLLGRPIIPDFMLAAYQSAEFTPLLWFALVVAAPLTEEVFFRGFLFEGIRYTRLGGSGAMLLTALGWALVHVQYDLYEISTVFALGLILAVARLRTNSLYTTIAMHSLVNLLATLEVVAYLHHAPAGT